MGIKGWKTRSDPSSGLAERTFGGTRTQLKREQMKREGRKSERRRESVLSIQQRARLSPFLFVSQFLRSLFRLCLSRSLSTCRPSMSVSLSLAFPFLSPAPLLSASRLSLFLSLSHSRSLPLPLFLSALGNSQAIHPRMHEMTMMMMPGTLTAAQHADSENGRCFPVRRAAL